MILARESARSRHVPTQQELTDYISDPRRWSWDIAPDLSKPGYTIAFARFTPLAGDDPALVDLTSGLAALCGANGIRLHVVPKAEDEPETPPIVTHDIPHPQPTPQNPDKPKAPEKDNSVTPEQDDEQAPVVKRPVIRVQTRQNAERVSRAASPIKVAKQARASLPQTGEMTSVVTVILAILTLGLSLLLFRKPKRQN